MAKVGTPDDPRRPVILIRSSPWKASTEQTPLHDVFDMDNGHVRYFGDNKASTTVARCRSRAEGAHRQLRWQEWSNSEPPGHLFSPILKFQDIQALYTP
ncbi:hypothetical protein [Streptomyces aureus]|uniref:hypothetical protein n=1 Tax=Streptomyces aureus TaxID=193461 RepID=UPI001FD85663|nr:hypothetical protein [Streptomyces aureus]